MQAGYDRRVPSEPVTNGLEVYREFVDREGKLTNTARLGEPLTVHLTLRSLKRGEISNVAVVDLLPGGFEIIDGALRHGRRGASCDYVDVREDRALFYGQATASARTITYQIKPTNRGEFTVPPPYAESMYDRGVFGRGTAAKITVVDAK